MDRFFVRQPISPDSLALITLENLAHLINSSVSVQNVQDENPLFIHHFNQIRRVDSTAARNWAQKSLPSMVREALIAYATSKISTANAHAFDGSMRRLSKFWSVLYSHHMPSISIPAEVDQKTKANLVMYLSEGLVDDASNLQILAKSCFYSLCLDLLEN